MLGLGLVPDCSFLSSLLVFLALAQKTTKNMLGLELGLGLGLELGLGLGLGGLV